MFGARDALGVAREEPAFPGARQIQRGRYIGAAVISLGDQVGFLRRVDGGFLRGRFRQRLRRLRGTEIGGA